MGFKDRRNVILAHVIVIGITDLLFTSCVALPMFDPEPSFLELLENTPIGTTLFVLRATDVAKPFNEMIFYPSSAVTYEYVNINQTRMWSPATANITLKKELDRDSFEGGIELVFSLTETDDNMIHKSVRLYIMDVCDERPKFDNLSYTLEINEPKTKSEELKKIYRDMFTIDPYNGSVFLMRSLDYKQINVYQFTVHANDTCGLTADPANLIILVMDVPDATTFFTRLPYTSNEYYKNDSNTPLSQVTAFNGSTISYSTNKYSSLDVPLLASLLPALLVLLIVCIVLGIFSWRRKQNAKMSNTKRNDATGSVKEVAVTESPEAAYESLDDYYMSLDKCKGITPEYDQITHDCINKTGL